MSPITAARRFRPPGPGTATILSGKIEAMATLVPDGDNRMKDSAKYAPMPGMKVVVCTTLFGKQPEQVHLTLLANAQDAHPDHKH